MTNQEYQKRFVEIVIDAFSQNPSVTDVVKQDSRKAHRTRKLAEYSFHFGERRAANYLSKDGNGIVISYVEDMRRSFADHWADLKLIFEVSGFRRARYLLKKEAYRKKVRQKEPFYYVWFLGVDSAHRGGETIKELKRRVFDEADRLQLPILLETTIERNKSVYEYFGFQVYHIHQFHEDMPPTYFMKRPSGGESDLSG